MLPDFYTVKLVVVGANRILFHDATNLFVFAAAGGGTADEFSVVLTTTKAQFSNGVLFTQKNVLIPIGDGLPADNS